MPRGVPGSYYVFPSAVGGCCHRSIIPSFTSFKADAAMNGPAWCHGILVASLNTSLNWATLHALASSRNGPNEGAPPQEATVSLATTKRACRSSASRTALAKGAGQASPTNNAAGAGSEGARHMITQDQDQVRETPRRTKAAAAAHIEHLANNRVHAAASQVGESSRGSRGPHMARCASAPSENMPRVR